MQSLRLCVSCGIGTGGNRENRDERFGLDEGHPSGPRSDTADDCSGAFAMLQTGTTSVS
jgi:hypothetical protein